MRSLLLALLAVALAAALFLASQLGDRPKVESGLVDLTPETAPVGEGMIPAPTSIDAADRSDELAEVDGREDRTAALESALEVEPEFPLARLFGRVVDPEGAPVAGLSLELGCQGAWRDGFETPTYASDRSSRRGWSVETRAGGRFAFEVPVPTSDWVTLTVRGDPYFGLIGRNFGEAGGRKKPPIVEGANDLGDLVVPRTGAITGTVMDSAGVPIERARVTLDGSFPGGLVIGTYTDAAGRYELGHVPPGPTKIQARHPGHLLESTEGPSVEAQRTVAGPSFTLASAPSIRGTIVDANGAPIPGIRVWGWPIGSGRGAGAQSGDDGTFVMFLPQDEPYILEVDRDSRYVPWGGRSSDVNATFAPGTTDVRIELQLATRLTLRVLDGATDEPVVRFSVGVTGEKASGGARLADHGGEVDVSASPGPHSIVVEAPGYVPLTADVAYDDGENAVQTVRLARGVRVRGRVTIDGEGVPAAQVTFEPQKLPKEDGGTVDPDDWLGETWRYDVEGEAAKRRDRGADATGSFRIDGIAPGTYRLTAKGEGGSPTKIENLVIDGVDDIALGDVELVPEATLAGEVRLAGGASAVGLELSLGLPDYRRLSIESADGTFMLAGLPPGEHSLMLKADGHRVLGNVQRTFTIAEGETLPLVIDLTAEGVVELAVVVRSGAAPLAGVDVTIDRVQEHEGTAYLSKGRSFGRTDAEGRAVGPATAGQRIRVAARDGELLLGHSDELVPAAGGGDEVVVDVSFGSLELRFPEGFELPEDGLLNVRIRPAESDVFGLGCVMQFHTEGSQRAAPGRRWTGVDASVGRLAAGRYVLDVNASSLFEGVQSPVTQPYSETIEIVEGETLSIQLER